MLALLASLLFVAYLLVPGVLFRTVFSLFVPLKAFDRTRTQEFGYSAVVCALPFFLALTLVWHTPLGRHPFAFPDTWSQRNSDYKTVLLASFEENPAGSKEEFWNAAVRSVGRQGRLLSWYLAFVSLEALLLGFLASKWGVFQPTLAGWTERLVTRLLLQNVSEWHVLLTNFLFPGTTIHADVLTAEDHLYRGEVLDYTRNREGSLIGIYLNNAERYDRTGLLADREKGHSQPKEQYWKPIPGKRLFIFADKLFTLNIRPQTTLEAAKALALELDPAATVTVRRVVELPSPGSASDASAGTTAEGQEPPVDRTPSG